MTPTPYRNVFKLVELHEWIAAYTDEHKYPPSNRDIVKAGFTLTTSNAHRMLRGMCAYGMAEVTANVSRGIKLLPIEQWDKAPQAVKGRIAK